MRGRVGFVALVVGAALIVGGCSAAAKSASWPTQSPQLSQALPTHDLAKFKVPKELVGDWTATEVMGAAVGKSRPPWIGFSAEYSPGDGVPYNGGIYDGCNGGSLLATFGSGHDVTLTQGVTTLAFCPHYPMTEVFAQTRTWQVDASQAGSRALTLYDETHHVTARFVRAPAGRK